LIEGLGDENERALLVKVKKDSFLVTNEVRVIG